MVENLMSPRKGLIFALAVSIVFWTLAIILALQFA
jgi:hypothetical protein